MKEDDPIAPADLTNKRTCDPSVTQYGCCLLEDKPADGPDYQGCPRESLRIYWIFWNSYFFWNYYGYASPLDYYMVTMV